MTVIDRTAALLPSVVFIGAAILAAARGYIPLKTGHRIERRRDPFGYWAAITGLVILGMYLLHVGTT
jgi:hypothetical protein